MPGIMGAEKQKKTIRLAVWLLQKKLGKKIEDMAYDLEHCGNPVFKEMYQVMVKDIAENIEEDFQKRTVLEVGTVFLWILYKDTAYKDPAYYGFYRILLKAPQLLTLLKDYVKPPEEWYVNVWHRTKKHTREKRKRGDIPEYAKSDDESIFTPGEQAKKLKRL